MSLRFGFVAGCAVIFFVASASGAAGHLTAGASEPSTAAEIAAHTKEEEAEGLEIWQGLQDKRESCKNLSDGDFAALGEYFMGRMMGDAHAAMNEMMIRVHGVEGEEEIHAVMGKRLSGCVPSALFQSQIARGWMPMMQMMWGAWSGEGQGRLSPLGWTWAGTATNFAALGLIGSIFALLWMVVLIVAIVVSAKWLINQFRGRASGSSALRILGERYARGEIDRSEFESKKRDLGH